MRKPRLKKAWYEALKFKTNPFSIKPTEQYIIHGHTTPTKTVKEAIKKKQIVVVQGKYGLGKTSFLKTIIDEFKGARRVIYFSCNRLVEKLDCDKLLTERYGVLTKTLNIKSKNMILLLDEAEYLTEEDIESIMQYHKDGFFSGIVFVVNIIKNLQVPKAHASLFKKQTVQFRALPKKTVVRMIRERIGEHSLLPDDVIQAIYEKDKRIRYFLKNCDTYMRIMYERKKKTATVADVEKAFCKEES